MRERAESLRPHHTEIAEASVVDFREAAVEDVGQYCHRQTCDDGFTTFVEPIRDIAEGERDRNLDEETNGSQGVGAQRAESKLFHQRWGIGVETTLRSDQLQQSQNIASTVALRSCGLTHPLLHRVMSTCIHILQLLNCGGR